MKQLSGSIGILRNRGEKGDPSVLQQVGRTLRCHLGWEFQTNLAQLSPLSGVALAARQATKDVHGSSPCGLYGNGNYAELTNYKVRLKLPPLEGWSGLRGPLGGSIQGPTRDRGVFCTVIYNRGVSYIVLCRDEFFHFLQEREEYPTFCSQTEEYRLSKQYSRSIILFSVGQRSEVSSTILYEIGVSSTVFQTR